MSLEGVSTPPNERCEQPGPKGPGFLGLDDNNVKIFHGEVIDLNDVITFQGSSVDELLKAFQDSVDDYLFLCKKRGEKPEKPFFGK